MPGDLTALQSDPANTIQELSGAIFTHIRKGEKVPQSSSDRVIRSLREGLPTRPRDASLALASALLTRFVFETHSTDDCEEGIAILDKLIASIPPEDNADQYRARAAEMIALLALARSIIYSDPGHSEEAILRCRAALSFSSLDDQLRVVLTQALAIHAEQRFKYFGIVDGLQEAITLVPEIVNLLSSGEGVGGLYTSKRAYSIGTVVERIEHLEGLLLGSTSGSPCHRTYLEDLACWYDTKFSRTGDVSDIKMAIRYRRMLLIPPYSDHPFLFIPLCFLCDDFLIAFERTGSVDYLDESIILHHNVLTMQGAKALHFAVLRRLVPSLCIRYRLFRRRQDLDEMMRLFSMAIDDRYVSVAERFKFSCVWAFLARHFGHSSASSAYESAMSLSQSSLAFAPTVQVQQARLVGMGGTCERMPLDYASYQIGTGCVEQAIETLERGRALLWSEMRGFRSSIDQLISSYLPLAERLTSLNRKLEILTVSATLGVDVDDGSRAVGGLEGNRMDPFCRLVTKQRKLSKERDALVSHIRSLPGFGDFLTPPSFDALRSAASHGPVIIINHSKWRSDILILLHDSPPSLIPTPSNFYDRANRLKDQLLSARRGRGDVLSTTSHACTVRSVLADLYALVGRPVLERLRALGIPEQSRIWWCPTSAFCFLPLHAMGPIPSSDGTGVGTEQYFCDLYIPSYTPTLSALIESRKPVAPRPSLSSLGRWQRRSQQRPPLLLVAYHEDNLGGMGKEIKTIQGLGRTKVKSLVGKKATKAAVIEGLEQHRFAHIAGSVKLVPGRPFDAPFRLHGNERLTLLDIAKCRFSSAEFAFLSASHTAELTDPSHPDEALHLTAAMQHCGFRSVVGTMWAMADMDGRDLCKRFYKLMFEEKKGQQEGVPYHERAAKALRDAVQKLRKKKDVTVDCWVTYVHYGA
ncbi:CHAT domain-containing protein [Russula emetica]|nr:CHAT domain-containing protein [Russula emetica]